MPKRQIYHITKNQKKGWDVKKEGSQRASGNFRTKQKAVQRGKELAKNTTSGQIKIHKSDGKFQTEHTYGKDPHPPEG